MIKNHWRVFTNPATINKRAQVGETMTWVVATLIIIVILMISVFVVVSFNKNAKEFDFKNRRDLVATKSLSGFLLTSDDPGSKIYNEIVDYTPRESFVGEGGALTSFSGELAKKIFFGLYLNEYSTEIWLGLGPELVSAVKGLDSGWNPYFFHRPVEGEKLRFVIERVSIKEKPEDSNKYIELILSNE